MRSCFARRAAATGSSLELRRRLSGCLPRGAGLARVISWRDSLEIGNSRSAASLLVAYRTYYNTVTKKQLSTSSVTSLNVLLCPLFLTQAFLLCYVINAGDKVSTWYTP